MLKLEDLQTYLEKLFSDNGITDFCPNGLQVEGKRDVARIGTAVSANIETLETAVAMGIDALIVHHGIFWNRDNYCIHGTKRKKLMFLLENEISLFAYHLPLDLHPLIGNNWKAAKDLRWSNLQPFGYVNGIPIGVKGSFSPLSREKFKTGLEKYYEHSATFVWGGEEIIETAALVSGGAHKTLLEAAKEKVDLFITGSFDEPTWHEAIEEKINFLAMGHSATERVGPLALAQHLREELHCPAEFIDIKNLF